MSQQLAVNLTNVVHETIDGETILIHLGTGTYYSLDGSGAAVWQLLSEGVAHGELAAQLGARYEADPAAVESSVARFVGELLGEGLLVAVEPGSASPSPPAAGASTSDEDASSAGRAEGNGVPGGGGGFVEPVLHKYTDMQEFMLVDPLHDVEADAGWPHVKAG
jgi:Coenzyme PQQ synthesis protein D (PqqD)